MRRSRRTWVLLAIVVVPVALLVGSDRAFAPDGSATDKIIFDLEPGPRGVEDSTIPPDCSTWHELYPNYCVPHHQDAYDDGDGSGTITPCDNITLDGVCYHIVWVGPTYFMSEVGGGELVTEPTEPQSGGDPTCEIWHEVYPVYCNEWHVDGWEDNGDGELSVCDNVLINGIWWHIDEIGLDIEVEPDPSAVESSTWGKVKSLFRDVF